MFLRPIIHIYDDTLFVMQRKWFQMSPLVSHLTTTMYCGCYAMSFVLFALQFLYRYVATCKPLYVELFQGIRFLFWIFGAFSIALSWEAAAFFLFPQSDRTQKMFLHILKYSYDLDPDFMDYVPYRYFENDEGVRRVIMLNIVGIIQHVIIMGVSFGTLFYCAFKTYTTISRHKGMSVKTKELQMQLFRALVVQATIPTIFMYFPLLFLYACPLINLQLGPLANYQTIMGQLYPGVDPFAVLFLINVYRRTLFNINCFQIGFVYALLLYEGHQFKRTHITKELSLQEGTYSVPKVLQSVQGVNIMSDNYWFELTNVIGQIGFYVSVAANFILLLLIHYVSCVMMGSYKTLLIFITFFSMFFSFVEMEAKPLIHMYDNTLFLIYQKWEHKSGLITKIIPTTYCWCYSMSFALLTLQFIYRYIAICRYSLLNYIEGKTVYLWLLGATLIGGTWAAAVLLLFPHTEKTDESFRHLLNESYRLDPRVTDYVPYKYFYIVNGTRIFDKINMTGVVHHLFVIAITLLIVVFCGVSIYRNAKKQETASSKTRRLQIQLFRALIFQTLIPCFFNFLPLTFLYLCPILNIQLGPRTNYQVIMAQIYPAMDPIVLFFIIEDYRSTLFDIIMFRWTSKIACYDYDQTQYAEFMRTETNSRRITIF